MDYDFTTLSPDDFTALVADLFSRIWDGRLESFKPGKDGGIDLRHARVAVGTPTTIIQCKRYAPHKFAELKRSLALEKPKLDILRPDRYVVATSVGLTPANKKSLADVLAPWCLGPSDIYGPQELNGMLRDHPQVERAHFKLWISSTTVLERVLNARIFNQTAATLDAAKQQLSRLVMHQGFNRALQMLEEQHHVLIMGNPGIGKTTLARMLMCYYVQKSFEPISVSGSIDDAWQIVHSASPKNPMVVLYDDFLGRLEYKAPRFGKNEEHSLLQFLDKVRRTPYLRFVLTTREYILADAQNQYGLLDERAQDFLKCTITLEDYTKPLRAHMLFNHLYFSDLPDSRLEKLVASRAYRNIIEHPHFNPRTIETVSRHANSHSLSDAAFLDYIDKEMSDPSRIWRHAFLREISPASRLLLGLLWSFDGAAEHDQLRSAFLQCSSTEQIGEMAQQFNDSLKELDGTFILSNRYPRYNLTQPRVFVFQFHNPSVEDFLENFLKSEPVWLERLVHGIVSLRQADTLVQVGLKAHPSLPQSFWIFLRSAAARTEDRSAGSVINFKNYLDPQPRKTWAEKEDLAPHKTQVRLQIEVQGHFGDEVTHELLARVCTEAGWRRLLETVPTDGSAVYSATRLKSWIKAQRGWPGRSYTSPDVAFRLAVSALLGKKDLVWAINLSSIRVLVDAVIGDAPLSQPERDCFLKAAQLSLETLLDNSTDASDIEAEAGELGKIADLCGVPDNFKNEQEEVRKRLERLSEDEQHGDEDEASDYRFNRGDTQDFNVDSLFRSLLDR